MDRRFLLLLTLFAVVNKSLCRSRHKTNSGTSHACSYQYKVQPWQNPVLAQCNPLGVTVTLACTVQGLEMVSDLLGIIWQRAGLSSPDQIGTSASQNSFLINNRYSAQIEVNANTNRISSRFTITSLQVADYGYYWCMVSYGTMVVYPTPSKVIRIAEPCNSGALSPCNASVILYSDAAHGDRVCAERNGPTSVTQVSIPSTPNCTIPTPSTAEPHQTPTSSLVTQPYVSSEEPTSIWHTSSPSPSVGTQPKLESSTSGDEEGIERFTWLFIGLTAAVLLVIICVLLTLIVCAQCKGRQIMVVHDTIHVTDVETKDGELIENGRLGEPATQEESQHETRDQTNGPRVHDYTEIPDFLEEKTIVVYQNIQETGSTKPGQYDDVLPDPSRSTRRHSYDRVIDDGSQGYHRLQHQGSIHSLASQRSSLKLQTSRQSLDAANLTSPPPNPETTARRLESAHHQIDIYQEELASQASEDVYHHLDRPSAKPSLKPSMQVSHDTGPHYSQLSSTAAPIGDCALSQQVGSEHQLPEVRQYESLYRGLAEVQESQDGKRGPRSTPGRSKYTDQLPEASEATGEAAIPPEFESLYSPVSEFGVVIGKTDEDCDTETLLGGKGAQKEEYPQTETAETMVNSKAAGGILGSASVPTTGDPQSPNMEPLDDYSTLLDGSVYYHQLEPPEANSEEERPSNSIEGDRGPKTRQSVSRATNRHSGDYSHLELEYPVHNYSPIIPNERNSHNQYNVPIITSSEMYRSEHDHVYHVLETS